MCCNIACFVRLLETYLHFLCCSEQKRTMLYRSGSLASTLNRPDHIAAKTKQDNILPVRKNKFLSRLLKSLGCCAVSTRKELPFQRISVSMV
jgi:hypothetical protein